MSGAIVFAAAAAVLTVLSVLVVATFLSENRANFDNWKDFFR